MTVTVRSGLNHYEVLGVSPTAAGDEIARAFAREGSVFRPHAFGNLTELCVAYETLRDPIKRRAYDAAIGLEREPDPQNRSIGVREARTEQEPTTAAEPEPQRPALPLGPGSDSNARPEPRLSRGEASHLMLAQELGAEVRPIDWRRTATVLGTVVVAACVVGGVAGYWSASAVDEAPETRSAASVPLPATKHPATPTVPEMAPAPVSSTPKVRPARPKPVITTAVRTEPAPEVPERAAVEEQTVQGETDPSPGRPATVEVQPTSPISTNMPLPDRVIARTIERIGYSCGSVDSTVPVEGEAAGVFKVNCSSGQSYQARPVNGRYRFRRWGAR